MKNKNSKSGQYIFEANDFDRLEELARQAAIKAAREAEEAKNRKFFTEEQLAAAQQESYDQGYLEGVRETTANQEERIINALDKLIAAMDHLTSRQEAHEALQKKETAILALNIAKRFVPNLLDKYASEEIFKLIRSVLNDHTDQSVIKVRLNPEVHDDIDERLDPLVKELGFEGKIDLVSDLNLAQPDCIVEWQNGGVERLHHELWQDITDRIAHFLNVENIPNLTEQTKSQAEKQQAATDPIETEIAPDTDSQKTQSKGEENGE